MNIQSKKNNIFKLFVIIISTVLMFIYIFPWNNFGFKNIPFSGEDYKLGLDLQGGIELDYKVDLDDYRESENYDKTKESDIIEGLKSIIDKRIQTLNINDSEINDSSYAGEEHIIVQIPLKGNSSFENSENIEKAKEAIGKVVKIIFKEKRTEITEEDIQARLEIAQNVLDEIKGGESFSVVADKTKLNIPNVFIGTAGSYTEIVKDAEGVEDGKINEAENIKTGEKGYFLVNNDSENTFEYIFINKSPSEWKDAQDSKGRILNDNYFENSSVQFNQAFSPQIELTFNQEGAEIFGEISKRLVGEKMAIFVGGEMLTDPVINEAIYGGKAVITGNYTIEEAKKLSQDINTGVVPAPIYLTSEKTIDSKIGASSLDKLIVAGITGFIFIFIFLLIVYRASGLMAGIALFIYGVIILFILKILGTVLTLASIAGLILTFGMAIDANILIFERIKGELEDGKTIGKATKIGFSETWSAIWDSNFTGLITAIVLFVFGINMIKGFGLMLGIGIVVSFFTVMVISRIFLEFLVINVNNKKNFIGYKKK